MLIILVSISLHCIIYGLLEYAYDGPHFVQGKLERLTMPSVIDLPDSASRYMADRYVKEVILPAERFFFHESEFSNCSDSGYSTLYLFLDGFSFVFIIVAIVNSLSGFVRICATIAVAVAFCALAHVLIRTIYKNYFALEKFNMSVEELRERFSGCELEFPVNDKRAFDNFVILHYSKYYSSIAWSVQKRKALISFLDKASAVVYFILFWSTHGE